MLHHLDKELVADVLGRLAPPDIAAFAGASHAALALLNCAAISEPVFSSLAGRRWHRPRHALGCGARRLYASANGWRLGAAGGLGLSAITPADGIVSAAAWMPGAGHLALATGDELQIWQVAQGVRGRDDGGSSAPRLVGSCALKHPEAQLHALAADNPSCRLSDVSSCASGSVARAAVPRRLFSGDSRGRLSVFKWGGGADGPPDSGETEAGLCLLRELSGGGTFPIVDVLPLGSGGGGGGSGTCSSGGGNLVVSLHDGTFVQDPADVAMIPDNCVRVWDVEAGAVARCCGLGAARRANATASRHPGLLQARVWRHHASWGWFGLLHGRQCFTQTTATAANTFHRPAASTPLHRPSMIHSSPLLCTHQTHTPFRARGANPHHRPSLLLPARGDVPAGPCRRALGAGGRGLPRQLLSPMLRVWPTQPLLPQAAGEGVDQAEVSWA
jgi:hypothetical protein